MKHLVFLSMFFFSFFLSASAQTTDESGKPVFTQQYGDAILKVDSQFLKLTPDQIVQAKKVLGNYRDKYNAMAGSTQGIDQYKAALHQLDVERMHGYKVFLTKEQYELLIGRYNKFHTKTPIE